MSSTTVGDDLVNDGTISTSGGTLTLRQFSAATTATFDLDGGSGDGIVTVSSTTSDLVIDGPLNDAYNGVMTVGDGNSITFNEGWTLSDVSGAVPEGHLDSERGRLGQRDIGWYIAVRSRASSMSPGPRRHYDNRFLHIIGRCQRRGWRDSEPGRRDEYAGGSYTGAGEIYQSADAT